MSNDTLQAISHLDIKWTPKIDGCVEASQQLSTTKLLLAAGSETPQTGLQLTPRDAGFPYSLCNVDVVPLCLYQKARCQNH
jgi:hypothetical protein